MLADCPKCKAHIKVYQMSPYCKKCGVHLMFASFEDQFQRDRRIAEMSMANFRYVMTKIKSAFISGIAQKIKIVASFLPLIALLLPLGSVSVNTAFYSSSLSFNVLGLFYGPFFGNGLFGRLGALSGIPVFGPIASSLKTLIIVYTVITVCAVIILLCGLLCFTGNKKTCYTSVAFSVTGFICTVIFKVLSSSVISACESTGTLAEAKSGNLFIAVCFIFLLSAAASVFSLIRPPVCVFREGDELRVQYRRKYKKGLIALMDIPAPIYESENDRKEREKYIKEAYNINEETEAEVNV